MKLFRGKKSLKNIKLDDYAYSKINDLKKILSENKTIIAFTLLGSSFYMYKLYFNV